MEPDNINESLKIEETVIESISQIEESLPAPVPREFKKNSRKSSPRRETRVRPEFDQKIISIRRVTRVVTGGRRFSFSVGIVIGDRKGRVGVGLGKAGDTPLAIDKAVRDAKKNMIKVNLTKSGTIAHEVRAKYSSSRILISLASSSVTLTSLVLTSII